MASMILCNRPGCGIRFDPELDRQPAECTFHDGSPVFHEGLKSWSCCKDINKPVMEFDQFQRIPGCTKSTHLQKAASAPSSSDSASAPSASAPAPTSVSSSGVESYGSAPPPASAAATASTLSSNVAVASSSAAEPTKPVEDEQDDPNAPIPAGAKCKRRGCGREHGDDEGECIFHRGLPVFREGSKGYSCCKRRVLEPVPPSFDEFLKIEGCQTGRHLFVGAKASTEESAERELVPSRVDFYQTVKEVHVSVFAKGADKQLSTVTFDSQAIHLDLALPQNKRTLKTVALYGAIDPAASTFSILGTKVAITLTKADGKSWPVLEVAAGVALPPGYAVTFGASGRTGTVGGKEAILAPESR